MQMNLINFLEHKTAVLSFLTSLTVQHCGGFKGKPGRPWLQALRFGEQKRGPHLREKLKINHREAENCFRA